MLVKPLPEFTCHWIDAAGEPSVYATLNVALDAWHNAWFDGLVVTTGALLTVM
jgi:hypothetical protein